MSANDELTRVFEAYTRANGGKPESPLKASKWGLENGLIPMPKMDPADIVAGKMARALREQYAHDPKTGRRYRKYHAVRITKRSVQFSLWANMDEAPRDHMVKAFQQRRQGIVGDCIQLKADVDVYNGRASQSDAPIQLVLDFTDDVLEHEAAEGIESAA